jgi:hypothetical protein
MKRSIPEEFGDRADVAAIMEYPVNEETVRVPTISGLSRKDIIHARRAENECLKSFKIFTPIKMDEAKELGMKVFRGRWVDVAKNGGAKSRWVCMDFKYGQRQDEYFASTPSSDSTRLMETWCMYKQKSMAYADVSTAFLHAREKENCSMIPPAEWGGPSDSVWRLDGNLYGRRPAMRTWQEHATIFIKQYGLTQSNVDGSMFDHNKMDMVLEIHVDDISMAGTTEQIRDTMNYLKEHLRLKVYPTIVPGGSGCFLGREKVSFDGEDGALVSCPTRSTSTKQ